MTTFETQSLLMQLEAVVEENLDRHLGSADDWMPHRVRPVERGAELRTPRR